MRWLAAFVAAMLAAPVLAQVADPVVVPTAPISPTGQPLDLGDDQTRRVDLGFTFDYFGQSFTQAWVSSNGFVSFLDGNPRCCEGLPIDQAPRNTIFGVWTDLFPISGPNPFSEATTEDGLKAYIATWYRQHEYYNGNTNTFQIVLREDGTVSIRYDDVNLSGHRYLAGLTGPTAADQYQISYGFGGQINTLDGNTYSFFGKPLIEVVDCALTPLDPSCFVPSSPVAVSPIPSPVEQAAATPTTVEDVPVAAESETVVESEAVAAEPESEAETVEAAVQAAEQVAPVAVEQAAATEAAASKDTKATATATTAQAAPPPLPPGFSLTGPVAASSASSESQTGPSSTEVLLANVDQVAPEQEAAQATQVASQQAAQGATTTEQAFAVAFGLGEPQPASGGPVAGLPGGIIGMSTDNGAQQQASVASDERQRQEPTSASSPMRVLEALNSMSAGAVPSVAAVASSGPEPSALAGDQSATINEMGFVPGFAAYAQVTIPDRPFYPPVVIYRRNRPVDANMTMYRLLQSNSRTWDALMESQYER